MSGSPLLTETIAAMATAPGAAGIGIIRISGDQALLVAQRVFRPYRSVPLVPRYLTLGQVVTAVGQVIDEAMAVFFPTPHSYTAEDVVELQCHGGQVVLRETLGAVLAAGARLAQPGEFTLRAFLNGRLDLAQAEAVMDVITAKTAASLQLAEEQLQGGLSARVAALEEQLRQLLARVAAAVDFPEEVEAVTPEELAQGVAILRAQTQELLAGAQTGRIYREGLSVVLLGKANAGKSSLLNALLEENRAIVTAQEGTTRDVVEEYCNLAGLPLLISDTAGLRAAQEEAEQLGIQRSREKAAAAQVLLLVLDLSQPCGNALPPSTADLLAEYEARRPLVVLNKCDLAPAEPWQRAIATQYPQLSSVVISAKTGEGLEELKTAIVQQALTAPSGDAPILVSNRRHQEALWRVASHLEQAAQGLEQGVTVDLVGIDLDEAWQAVGEISGKTAGEDLLGQIFSSFCVGK